MTARRRRLTLGQRRARAALQVLAGVGIAVGPIVPTLNLPERAAAVLGAVVVVDLALTTAIAKALDLPLRRR